MQIFTIGGLLREGLCLSRKMKREVSLNWIFNTTKGKILIVFIALSIGIYLTLGSWINRIHLAERKINSTWAQLKQNCDQRTQLLPQFVQLIQSYAPEAQDLISKLDQSYQISSKNHPSWDTFTTAQNLNEFTSLQANVLEALKDMDGKSARYAALAQNRQFLMLKMEWEGLDQQIQTSVKKLNQNIEDFNRLILGFWPGLINNLFIHESTKEIIQLAQS